MIKKISIIFSLIFITNLQARAFEDVVIMTKGKMTDIRIENNQIIDVYPLITISNDKNTLMVHPLTTGQTCFTILKNGKEKFLFQVKITEDKTTVRGLEGFEILTLDQPPESDESFLDEPPMLMGGDS